MAGGGSKGGGGSDTQTTTQKSEPWGGQQPYLLDAFAQASGQYHGDTPQYYPNSTMANQSAATLGGQQAGLNAAGNGQSLVNGATGLANSTINGDYLSPDSNPFLKATFDKAAGDVSRVYQTATAPGTDAAAVQAGRYNPAGALGFARESNQRVLGDNLNNLATSIYGGNYQAERGRQDAAMNNAGNIYNSSLMPAQTQMTIGGQQDARSQDVLNSDITRFNYNQNLPAAKLAQYQQMIQGNYGGNTTLTTPLYSNSAAGAAGAGLGLGSLMGGKGGGKGGGSSIAKIGNGIP